MTSIEAALISAINKYPQTPLVIAYSGGVDSQVLLHAVATLKHANKLPSRITVCHVNHGLSNSANLWQEFAQNECLKLNLTFEACKVSIETKAQQSLEAIARDARYKALHSIYKEQSLIITGHHRDDQAETFLLALKRGSGLKGLSAMAIETIQGKDIVIRPLLNVSREEIVITAKEKKLNWIEDESNTDTRFDRNFIRQSIMPLLNERWPSITQTITRSSNHCLEGQSLLNELAEQDLANSQLSENSLSVNELNQLSVARFNNLVRYFLAKHNSLMPSKEQLTQVYQQLFSKNDKSPAIKVANNYLRRYKGGLYLTSDFVDLSDWQENVDYSETKRFEELIVINLPDSLGTLTFNNNQLSDTSSTSQQIVLPRKGQKVTVQFYHNNPTCLPDYRHHSRSLKKVLQELDIPPWQRKRVPFIFYDNVLVAVIGHFVCQEFMPHNNKLHINVAWKY